MSTSKKLNCASSLQAVASNCSARASASKLIRPGKITFQSNSADVSSSFYNPLNQVVASLKQYDQSFVDGAGHTDSTGSRQRNLDLSRLRA